MKTEYTFNRYIVFQQYFMVSNAAQFILDEATKKGCNLHDLADYAVIQINDTHPSMGWRSSDQR